MTTNDDRIRTTHIGSLPRPPELLDLLKKRQEGEDVDADEWDATVADATRDIVERQAEVGIDIANNGEQSRVSFNWYVADRLSGIEGKREQELWADLQEFPEYADETFKTDVIDLSMQPVVTGPSSTRDRTRRKPNSQGSATRWRPPTPISRGRS